MKSLSNLRKNLHLTFHDLQTLGALLGVSQWNVVAALIGRTRNDMRYIGVSTVIRNRVQIVESRVIMAVCEYNTVRDVMAWK